MIEIKGYVQYFDRKVPVTWEKEKGRYVYAVRRVLVENQKMTVSSRLFDEKVLKKEIIAIN